MFLQQFDHAVDAIENLKEGTLEVAPLQSYARRRAPGTVPGP